MSALNPEGDYAADRAEKIVRRHAHDVRNHLNLLDLEAVLLDESTSDLDVAAAVRRMQAQIKELDAAVNALLCKFVKPCPVVVTAANLLQMW